MPTSSTPHIVTTPQLGVNDLKARLIREKAEGSQVQAGECLCVLETSKASFDVESPASGWLLYCLSDGGEASLHEPLLMVCASPEELAAEKQKLVREQKQAAISLESNRTATEPARRRATELGLELQDIKASGTIIQRADVERHVALQATNPTELVPIEDLRWDEDVRPVVIFGAGRGGQTVMECLEAMTGVTPVCFVDDQPGSEPRRHGLPLYGSRELEALKAIGINAIALAVAGGSTRLQLLERVRSLGFEAISVVHPTAFIARSCRLGDSLFVKAGALIETASEIGDACIIDNGVVIAHHNVIEAGCHLAPGVHLGSGITIGQNSILGIGVAVASGCQIGRACIISPGSSITKDIEPFSVIEGVPGRKIGEARH